MAVWLAGCSRLIWTLYFYAAVFLCASHKEKRRAVSSPIAILLYQNIDNCQGMMYNDISHKHNDIYYLFILLYRSLAAIAGLFFLVSLYHLEKKKHFYILYRVVSLRHLISVTRSDTAAVTAERLFLTFSVLSLLAVP